MRFAAGIAIGFLLGAMGGAHAQAYPDPALTPGVIDSTLTKAKICSPSFRTGPYRHTTSAMKRHVYAEYHRSQKPGVCCEVDHLVPLEMGGKDDIRNLWPEPYTPAPGAHQKDCVENRLRKLVCDGTLTLDDAQKAIIKDWYAAYRKYVTQCREGR